MEKLKTNNNGTYKGLFFAPINHLERITKALQEMAKTDEELDKAIKEGKKTFEGCDRFIRNNMADLAKELHQREIVFDDDSVHQMARRYMIDPGVSDASQIIKAVADKKGGKNEKSEAEPKKKEKKGAKIIPLTPQMLTLFDD